MLTISLHRRFFWEPALVGTIEAVVSSNMEAGNKIGDRPGVGPCLGKACRYGLAASLEAGVLCYLWMLR